MGILQKSKYFTCNKIVPKVLEIFLKKQKLVACDSPFKFSLSGHSPRHFEPHSLLPQHACHTAASCFTSVILNNIVLLKLPSQTTGIFLATLILKGLCYTDLVYYISVWFWFGSLFCTNIRFTSKFILRRVSVIGIFHMVTKQKIEHTCFKAVVTLTMRFSFISERLKSSCHRCRTYTEQMLGFQRCINLIL